MEKSQLFVLVFGMFVIGLRAQDATRGATLYKQQCGSCHGDGLEGRIGPSLTGADFQTRFPTSELIAKIKNTMPQDSPGKLTAGQAADLAIHSTGRQSQHGTCDGADDGTTGRFLCDGQS